MDRLTYYDETIGSFLLYNPREYEHWDLVDKIGELEDQIAAIIEIVNNKYDKNKGDI